MDLLPLLITLLIAMVWYVSIWFSLAVYLKRIDVIDMAWGIGFIFASVIAYFLQPIRGGVHLLALVLVTVWGLRLGLHIVSRLVIKSEDARYARYRARWGSSFLSKTYSHIYLTQGLLILIVMTPITAIMSADSNRVNLVGKLGVAVWIAGILFEAIADYQLDSFLKRRSRGEIMQSGLWRYSRHPNYFGELITWWGAALVAISLGTWWGIIGAVTISILIIKVSGIPPLEKRYAKDKAYQSYKQHTSVLMPLPKH